VIALGNASSADLTFVVHRVRELVIHHGEVALFIGPSLEIAAVPHHESGYAEALDRHAGSLVGRYRYEEDPRRSELPPIPADIRAHLAEMGRLLPRKRTHAK
jgi:hypothetical protein